MASHAIDHLRVLLDHLDGTDRNHQLEFFRAILATGPDALQELDGRLPGARAPRALRQLALEASFYFPWPEWVPILARILRYEADFPIFQTGSRALGRIGNPEALEALRELLAMRQGTEFREVIAEVLAETDPAEAFNHYLSRLLEGSANPGVANEAAQRLTHLVDASSLNPLKAVAMHPDLLVFRHALQLLAHVHTPEAGQLLLELLQDNHHEVLADRALKEALATIRSSPPAVARETAQEALAALGGKPDPQGLLRSFFIQVLNATEEGKPNQLLAVVTQTVDAMHLRARRLGFAVDAAAEGLAGLAALGQVDRANVLVLLVEAYREQTGREGLAKALARLAPAGDLALHELMLAGPDGAQRAAAVEILGERREEALAPALLRACKDPLTDIADRALFHLGRLACAEDLAHTLMHSAVPEELRLGLRLIGDHRFKALVPDLLELMKAASREDLVLLAIETLGAVGAAQAAQPLLDMLHSGQSPRLQSALALALRDLSLPEVAQALGLKADELRHPSLHAIAVEALALAHGTPDRALGPGEGPRLLEHVKVAWSERNPWVLRLRVVVALQGLHLDHSETWRSLAELLHECLAEKRPQGVWTPGELHQVQGAAREFGKR
jgi:HEAT repeat protein